MALSGKANRRPPLWLTAVLVVTALLFFFWHLSGGKPGAVRIRGTLPVFRLVEGAPNATHPYSPQVLTIPAGRAVAIRLTDNLGGCGLVTVFPKLGRHGATARVDVPIGATRMVELYAPRPGSYPYHCAGDMYFGVIKAR